jgi:hypothetical protein
VGAVADPLRANKAARNADLNHFQMPERDARDAAYGPQIQIGTVPFKSD